MTEYQERIAAIRERLAAATPAPWTEVRRCTSIHKGEAVYESYVSAGAQNIAYGIGRAEVTRLPQDRYTKERSFDAHFIANAPSDLAFLLAQLDAAQADTRRLDWIESHSAAVCSTEQWEGVIVRVLPTAANTQDECTDDCAVETRGRHWTQNVQAPTLREAIDKALAAGVSPEATEGNE